MDNLYIARSSAIVPKQTDEISRMTAVLRIHKRFMHSLAFMHICSFARLFIPAHAADPLPAGLAPDIEGQVFGGAVTSRDLEIIV